MMVIIVQEEERRDKSVVTGYGGTAGTGVDLWHKLAFDPTMMSIT